MLKSIKFHFNVGKTGIQVECDKMSDVHRIGATYAALPKKCTNCGSENIFLSYRNPQGNEYFLLECADCRADAKFGIYKDNKGLFWKNEKMAVFKIEKREGENKNPDQKKDYEGEDVGGEIPF